MLQKYARLQEQERFAHHEELNCPLDSLGVEALAGLLSTPLRGGVLPSGSRLLSSFQGRSGLSHRPGRLVISSKGITNGLDSTNPYSNFQGD